MRKMTSNQKARNDTHTQVKCGEEDDGDDGGDERMAKMMMMVMIEKTGEAMRATTSEEMRIKLYSV